MPLHEFLSPDLQAPCSEDAIASTFGAADNRQIIRIGVISGLTASGDPIVKCPGWLDSVALPARTVVDVSIADVGSDVAIAIGESECLTPIVLGILKDRGKPADTPASMQATLDGDCITLTAEKEIVLRCGAASITLTRDGRITIRGAHILTRSTGANRIKGASVEIN